MYYSNKLKAHTAKFPRFIYLFIYLLIVHFNTVVI